VQVRGAAEAHEVSAALQLGGDGDGVREGMAADQRAAAEALPAKMCSDAVSDEPVSARPP
jgi:hypothetical protein